MDFAFATADEVAAELAQRLKSARLAQGLQQTALANRAGVSAGTIKTLEKTGQSTLLSVIRVAQALGMVDDLAGVFERKVQSIADMEQATQPPRQRAPRTPRTDSASASKK